ncbi:MAG: hypothetical protein GF349_01805 [Candidatus Magasanikbacteria bacterium]|nr:hypothetical protein [Candidatus Magasanikbacteria bacterium]
MSNLIPKGKDRKYMLMGLRIAGDFGATIAVPLIMFVLLGQWLDEKYGSGPLFLVLAFVVSAILSGVMIYKKAKKYGEEYKVLDKKNTN